MNEHVLEGVKVADFSWLVVGPVITRYLAGHGATVLRIESSTRPDMLKLTAPYKDNIPGLNRSGYFANYNVNKYGVSLNLNHPRGPEVARKIVAWADIVTESFTPGTMGRWGLSYEEMRKIKPDIIMLSTCNQGQTGPHARHPGFGTQLVSLAGFTDLTGWPDRGPTQPYGAYTDVIAPRFGLAALIAALDYRDRTGKGQYLDLSQYEASLQFLAPLILDYAVNGREEHRMGNRSPYAAPHGAYRCQGDDRWCVIAVFTDDEWQSFCQVLGSPAWTQEARFTTLEGRLENVDELDGIVEQWTASRSAEEVMAAMQAAGVAAGVVQSAEDLHNDPHLCERGYFEVLEHPEIGRYCSDKPGFKLSKTPGKAERPSPCLGQHNEYVYKEILGLSEEEFVELLLAGTFE